MRPIALAVCIPLAGIVTPALAYHTTHISLDAPGVGCTSRVRTGFDIHVANATPNDDPRSDRYVKITVRSSFRHPQGRYAG